MAPPSAVAAEKVVQDFLAPPTGDPQADAMNAFARATDRLASAIEGFQPAADTIHGFGARLDGMCAWLKGKWPLAIAVGYIMLSNLVENPEEIVGAAQQIAKLFGAP